MRGARSIQVRRAMVKAILAQCPAVGGSIRDRATFGSARVSSHRPMFTGLVQAVGTVHEVRITPTGKQLHIKSADWGCQPTPGDSIAISGCCLTIAQGTDAHEILVFDVVAETLAKTTLGSFKTGSNVNIEPSLTLQSLIGGHMVQGHIDGVARVAHIACDPQDWRLRIEPPSDLLPFIIPKGSVTLDGVSLTIAKVDGPWFEVALIPTTLQCTTLSELQEGAMVNIEADSMAKTVVHYMQNFIAMRRE